VKLVLPEPESSDLAAFVDPRPLLSSSVLSAVEAPRAIARVADDKRAGDRVDQLLATVDLIELDRVVVERARALLPWALRSLDALQVASALSLGAELETFVSYDRRQLSAARDAGLEVLAPGA
jgi:predicted nucleic acid-binding protein